MQLRELQIKKKKLVYLITGFWLFIAILIYAESYLYYLLGGDGIQPVDVVQYAVRWTMWALLSPLIMLIALKLPVTQDELLKGLMLHLFGAFAVIATEFIFEIPIIRWIAASFFDVHEPFIAYLAVYISKFHVYLFLYFLIVACVNIILYVREYQQSKTAKAMLQSQLAQSELMALKMQLHPHFLFNTHHAIISLMVKKENEKAIKMLTRLSDLLRRTLDRENEQLITLGSELEWLKLYLDIQQIRFEDRLHVTMAVDHSLMNALVPNMILQPLVENAIEHGISKNSHAGSISITAEKSFDTIALEVIDDAYRLDKSVQEGIGLANVKSRLKQLFNGHSSFQLQQDSSKGVIARIEIPFLLTVQ